MGSEGPGGPAGIPSVCVNAKLTGSTHLWLQAPAKLHSRLSMVRAAHHLVALQPVESTNPSPAPLSAEARGHPNRWVYAIDPT